MSKHYVAHLDTGGISHSGQVIVGLGATPDEAKTAVVNRLRRGRPHRTAYGDILVTVQDVDDYYGIRVYGPLSDTTATEGWNE